MKADIDLVKKLTSGAFSVTEADGFFEFNRMTPEQISILVGNQDFAVKATASSGIRLEFVTDAEAIRLDGVFSAASSRKFAFFDIMINDVMLHHEGSDNYPEHPEFDFTIPLSGKMEKVCIHFPCLARTSLNSLEFINASTIEPVKKSKKMLCYGDSITQGYDAVYPSFAYANMLATALDAEMFNKAIGGEIFNPPFADAPDPIRPDVITIAYGTNDWRKGVTAELLAKNAADFINNLNKHYPGTPIIAILPIWRKDMADIHPAGDLENAIAILRKVYAAFDNVTVIDGMPLVPHLPEFYADRYLHPNDTGFLLYGNNLIKAVTLR